MSKIHCITITVRPYKKILNLDNKSTVWKNATQLEQQMYMDAHLKIMFGGCSYYLQSEEHKNKNLHYHGMIICTDIQKDIFHAQLNAYFGRCEVKTLGTHLDVLMWNKYVRKENGMIITCDRLGQPWEYGYEMYKHCITV